MEVNEASEVGMRGYQTGGNNTAVFACAARA